MLKKLILLFYIGFLPINFISILVLDEPEPHGLPLFLKALFFSFVHPLLILGIKNNFKEFWFWLPSLLFWILFFFSWYSSGKNSTDSEIKPN